MQDSVCKEVKNSEKLHYKIANLLANIQNDQ